MIKWASGLIDYFLFSRRCLAITSYNLCFCICTIIGIKWPNCLIYFCTIAPTITVSLLSQLHYYCNRKKEEEKDKAWLIYCVRPSLFCYYFLHPQLMNLYPYNWVRSLNCPFCFFFTTPATSVITITIPQKQEEKENAEKKYYFKKVFRENIKCYRKLILKIHSRNHIFKKFIHILKSLFRLKKLFHNKPN